MRPGSLRTSAADVTAVPKPDTTIGSAFLCDFADWTDRLEGVTSYKYRGAERASEPTFRKVEWVLYFKHKYGRSFRKLWQIPPRDWTAPKREMAVRRRHGRDAFPPRKLAASFATSAPQRAPAFRAPSSPVSAGS
eukprot:scaffold4058_cov257-Pinguiococcus_pyrenoidosus.AAC.8